MWVANINHILPDRIVPVDRAYTQEFFRCLRAIAVGGNMRTPLMPAVPTVAESGVPGYEMTGWFGLFSPAGVPRDILVQLNTEINRGLQSPAIKDILAQQGADPLQGSVDQYAAFVRNELAKWTKVVAAAGLKVE